MRALVLTALLLLVVPATAQDHEHGSAGGPVAVLTDLAPDGMALAGTPAHFAVVAFGDDAAPDFHQDLPVRVLLDGAVLWETTAASGHDYDGHNGFDVTFPHAGDWRVEALGADGSVLAHRNGTVVQRSDVEATFIVSDGTDVGPGGAIELEYGLHDAAGQLLNHTDVQVDVYRDDLLVLRTHTHTHTEAQTFRYAPREPGTHTVRLTGYQAYPTERGAAFEPVVWEGRFQVPAVDAPDPAAPADAVPAVPSAELNRVEQGTANGGPWTLLGLYDPYTVVGPTTLQHLAAMVVDPDTRAVAQHVDFTATLDGPTGRLFESESLHEYDGVYELATMQTAPGAYTLTVEASRGDWNGQVVLTYLVAPPAVATVAGPQVLTLDAPAFQDGEADGLIFRAADAAGNPFAHGELELDLRSEAGLPLLHAKLHTHDDGTFPATLAVPAGDNPLHVTPFPLMPQPAAGYYMDEVGTPLGFRLVADGGVNMTGDLMEPAGGPDAGANAAGLGVIWIVGTVAGTLFLVRRK